MYFDANPPFTPEDAHDGVVDFWTTLLNYILTGHTITVDGAVEGVDSITGDVTEVSSVTPATITCTRTGSAMPPAVQGLVQWRTGVYSDGREIRGRTFLPALTQDLGSNGVPTAAYLTQMAAAVTALLGPTTRDLVIWRRPRKARPQVGSKGDPWYLPAQSQRDGTAATVAAGTAWTKFAQLRSRRD
jgi:hypothetical protein